jgi:hypothetical protein
MKQTTFADSVVEIGIKKIRKWIFLEEMHSVVRWTSLVGIVQGYAPVAKLGQPPLLIEVLLRIRRPFKIRFR